MYEDFDDTRAELERKTLEALRFINTEVERGSMYEENAISRLKGIEMTVRGLIDDEIIAIVDQMIIEFEPNIMTVSVNADGLMILEGPVTLKKNAA